VELNIKEQMRLTDSHFIIQLWVWTKEKWDWRNKTISS